MKKMIALLLCALLAAPAAYAQSAPAAMQMSPDYLQRVANTLLTYPNQSQAILDYYVGVDTARIDMARFDQMVARGNPQEIYNEVSTLYNNRVAFNNGTFTDTATASASASDNPYAPGTGAKDTSMAANGGAKDTSALATDSGAKSTSAASAGAGAKSTTAASAGAGAKATAGLGATGLGNAATLTTLGLVAGGAGVAVAVGAGGGGDGNNGGIGGGSDKFNRDNIALIADPASFLDTEMTNYNLGALQKSNAQYAYARGLTGAGVKIGFLDWFNSDLSSDPMGSRVVYHNLNTAADCADPYNDCTHGADVMRYASDTRGDAIGSFGVAYEASLMMESVWASPTPNMRPLADNGADIINLSLGCTGCTSQMQSDLNYVTNKNIFVSIATGNEGFANPNAPASLASLYGGAVLAVTGVIDTPGGPSSYVYNQCGSQKNFCLAAYSDQGTSFAAPQVAGAAALLKQGWSFLTAKQIGQILLQSAKDIGAPGVDVVFGRGLLDIKAAVEPIGTTSLATSSGLASFAPSSIAQNQGTAFGDAFTSAGNSKGNVVVVDSFGRDFDVKTSNNTLVAQKPTMTPEAMNAFGSKKPTLKKVQMGENFSMSFSSQPNMQGTADMTSFAEYNVNDAAKVKLGFTTNMNNAISNDNEKFDRSSFISPEVFDNGFLKFSDNNQVFSQELELATGPNMKTKFSTYYSKNRNPEDLGAQQNLVTSDFASSIMETTFSPTETFDFSLRNGVTHEFNSLLGTQFSGAFDLANGSNTYFSGANMSYDLSSDVNLYASYNVGVTKATPSSTSAFTDVSDIVSDSFVVTATKNNLVGRDKASLSFGQPTRVESGSARGVTQTVDRNTGALGMSTFEQNLEPTARTLMFQAAYEKALADNMNLNFAAAYATHPDHRADMDAETTLMTKFVYKFR